MKISSINRLRFYGLDTSSEISKITQESHVSVQQVYGYDPPKIFQYGAEVRFCSMCDFISTRARYIAGIEGGPEWSSDPNWCLLPNTSLAAEIRRMPGTMFESLFYGPTEWITIFGSCKPSRLLLIGRAQQVLPSIPISKIQTFPILFTCTDRESVEVSLEFSVTDVAIYKKTTLVAEGSVSGQSTDGHPNEVDPPEGRI